MLTDKISCSHCSIICILQLLVVVLLNSIFKLVIIVFMLILFDENINDFIVKLSM